MDAERDPGYAADDMEYRAFNFPAVEEGGDTTVPVALNGFAIPTKAKNPEAAERFLAFLYAKDPMSKLTNDTLSLTVRSDIPVPADLQDIRDIVDQNAISGVNDQVPAVVPNFDTTVFQPATQALVTGRSPPTSSSRRCGPSRSSTGNSTGNRSASRRSNRVSVLESERVESDAEAPRRAARTEVKPRQRSQRNWFVLFVLPAVVLYALVLIGPTVFSIGVSLFQWNGLTPPEWRGLRNYEILFRDPVFLRSLVNTW